MISDANPDSSGSSPLDPRVFVVDAEVRALEGSEMWGVADSGFVYCYVLALDARQASSRVEEALTRNKFAIVSFEAVMPAEATMWDDGEEGEEAAEHRGYAEEAENSGEVVYSAFYSHEEEGEEDEDGDDEESGAESADDAEEPSKD